MWEELLVSNRLDSEYPWVGPLINWEIDESLATTSDHEVIVLEWTPLNEAIFGGKKEGAHKWDLDRFYADEPTLEAASEDWRELSEERALVDAWATSPTELESRSAMAARQPSRRARQTCRWQSAEGTVEALVD